MHQLPISRDDRGSEGYVALVIFPNVPQRRTRLAGVRQWRSTRRTNRNTTTGGIEDHQRMVQALRTAANEASRDVTTD